MAVTKKTAITELYNSGWEQKDIARILKLSEVTISKHVTKLSLKRQRCMQSIAKKTSVENALIALQYQSKIIKMIAQKLEEKLSDNPNLEDLKNSLIPKGEIDALQKLFTTIKTKEMEWSSLVKIIREFIDYIKNVDIKLAQSLVDSADDYINAKRRVM